MIVVLSMGLAACHVTVAPDAAREVEPAPKGTAGTPDPTAPTASAAPSTSAEPRLCGSRFPPCPDGTTCTNPTRGTCEPTR
jgi:hypothetical protein